MALAVLGGSFDPVHKGHVAMAEFVLEQGLAAEVLVVPARLSPFKTSTTATTAQRLTMVHLAFDPVQNCQVDDREIKRPGPSFMVDTLAQLHLENPQRPLRLILGADNYADFFLWKKADEILALAKIILLGRQGFDLRSIGNNQDSFLFQPHFDQPVSSTEIRAMLTAGQDAGGLLPTAVSRFIRQNSLYR